MTCNFPLGLAVSSPYGSPFIYDGLDPDDNILGGIDDENYFEFVFNLNDIGCDDGSCDDLQAGRLRVTGEIGRASCRERV